MSNPAPPQWEHPHDGAYPNNNRAVAVLLALKSGEVVAGIGRYYGKQGWSVTTSGRGPVVAWASIPSFEDTVELKDNWE